MDIESSKKKGYEIQDAATSPAVVGLVVLVMLMVGGFIGGQIFSEIFEATEVRSRPAAAPLSEREEVDGYRLQSYPALELKVYRQAEQRVLETYEWVDRSSGVIRVPVARAMELVLRDGLPKWEPVDARLRNDAETTQESPDNGGNGGPANADGAPPE